MAVTYYVRTDGSDANTGLADTAGGAFLTLQKAANAMRPGDTMIVRAGTYAAGFEISYDQGATLRMQFLADPGVTITGPSNSSATSYTGRTLSGNVGMAIMIGFNFSNSVSASMQPVTVQGFTIDGTNNSITDTAIYIMWADGSVVQNNTAFNVGGQGCLCKYSSNCLFQYNTFHDCGFNNIRGLTDEIHGLYVTDSCNHPTVRWNTLYHNLDSGLHMNGDAASGLFGQAGDLSGDISFALIENNVIYNNVLNGMNLDGVNHSVIRNNLLYQNGQASGHKDITIFTSDSADSPSNNAIYNNTITSTISDGTVHHNINLDDGTGSGNGNAVFNNIVYQVWAPNGDAPILVDATASNGTFVGYNALDPHAVGDTGDVAIPSGDPTTLFVNFGTDFRLKGTAAAVGQGVSSFGGFSASATVNGFAPTDLDGKTRGGTFDIGAFQFSTTPSTLTQHAVGSGMVAAWA